MKFLGQPSSGSYQGLTFSRNRFGQYIRNRATPVNPGSTFQGVVRARLAANAAAWRTLTDLQRSGWASLGLQMQRTDSLGQTYDLNGFAAYCSVNNNLASAGDALVDDAPALVTPTAPVLGAIVLSGAAFTVAYTPTPLGAGVRILAFASPQKSVGRFFNKDFRLIVTTAAAALSPVNLFASYSARLGTPVTGNKVFIALQTYNAGFVSAPTLGSAVVA